MKIVETETGWDAIKFESRAELESLFGIMKDGKIIGDDMQAIGRFHDTDGGRNAEKFCQILERLWFDW